MPPKASTASKQGPKKTEKKPQIQLDDFFTRFLYKKKRALNKKLQKIETLEQTPAAELNEQQRELVAAKKENLERLNYFDRIQDMYYEAYSTKDDVDEDGPAQPKTEKTASPVQQTESPAPKQVDEREVQRRSARSVAELVSVSSFFSHPQNKEQFTKSHGQSFQKKFGANFIDSVNSLWRSLTELLEVENQERTEEIAKVVESYLTSSDSLSAAANQTFQRLHEGVRALADEEGFRQARHATYVAETKAPQPQVEEPVRKGSEVKLVKNSKPASRKVSHQIAAKEEEVAAAPQEQPVPAEQKDFTKKPAKEVDPDEPQNTDDGWINVGTGVSTGRGRPSGRGAGRGRPRGGRGEGRPDRGNFRRERDEDGQRPQGEGDREDRAERGERRERRGGRRDGEPRQYDGERRQYDGERRQYDGERGERRQYNGDRKPYDGERKPYDGERKPYDGERRERRGGRPEGDRRPRGGDRAEGERRPRDQAEGARTESTK